MLMDFTLKQFLKSNDTPFSFCFLLKMQVMTNIPDTKHFIGGDNEKGAE